MSGRIFLGMVLLAGMLIVQAVPRAQAATVCDQAQFVSDLSAPDGSSFTPGASFTKTWRFANAGTCTWTTSYSILFAGGDAMNVPGSVRLPVDVPPGGVLDISVNLTAPMELCRSALPHMLAAGHGSIINVSSRQAERPSAGMAAYCASKGGLNALTRALAVEYGAHNIRANTLSPG